MTTMIDNLEPLIISAPFGNYIQPQGATATLGTFTAARRRGRVRQVLRTVRYYRKLGAWVNKIGLRNPGIDWLAGRVQTGKIDVADKIISIHGFNEDDWRQLLEKTASLKPLAIELNISCPNVGEVNWPDWLFERAVSAGAQAGAEVIVKLPPVNYELALGQARAAGIKIFHCCNTLPVVAGGMSGKPLKPLSLHCVKYLRNSADGADLTIIGGGGIYEAEDIDDYAAAGADHFAVGTKTMNPALLFSYKTLQPLIEKAKQSKINIYKLPA